MNTAITDALSKLEASRGFRILYACESGSRAWGFASADSDYDVRFLFAWPRDRYLSIEPPAEDIDLGIDENALDLSGWELRKALLLLRKSNGPLIEWLHSPIVYRTTGAEEILRALALEIFCPRSCAAHYLGLSKKMIAGIAERPETATAKRYLYALRSLLAAAHVLREQAPAPVAFAELLGDAKIGADLRRDIDAMIAVKSSGKESDAIGPQPAIAQFLDNEHQTLSATLDQIPVGERVGRETIDPVFQNLIA